MKSVFGLLVIGLTVVAMAFFMQERTALERMTDSWLLAACLVTLALLHISKRMDFALFGMLAMGLPGVVCLLLLNGNRDGDLYFIALMAICAIPILGPKRSIPVLATGLAAVVLVVAVDPILPIIPTDIHRSEINPDGYLFHAPSKQVISPFQAATYCAAVTLIYFVTYAAHRALARSKQRAEELLLNILPPSIAERLGNKDAATLESEGTDIADRFNEATILFADIVGFTDIAETTQAAELVRLLDRVFREFDALSEKHGVEKIKTIGDAYMAVSGLPERDPNHAQNVADMALDMIHTIARLRTLSGVALKIRIGINTGPVVAGVIGRKRFIYDLWGDAVNTASRMESHGTPDTIQTSEATYAILRNAYQFESLGEIDIKGKGPMPVWRLTGKRETGEAANSLA